MKFQILFILLFIFFRGNSQEILTADQLYFQDEIAYNKAENLKFSGRLQNKRKNGHIISEEIYKDGKQNELIVYYNINDKQIVSDIFFFDLQTLRKVKHINYSSAGSTYSVTEFDENEKKKSYSFYKNNVQNIYKEFRNGKKNGKWFCINEDGSKSEFYYNDGKKIKTVE